MSLTDFVVYTALHLPHSGPALLLLHLGVIMKDLVPQPGQIVDTHFVFLAFRDTVGDQLQNYRGGFWNLISYLNPDPSLKYWFEADTISTLMFNLSGCINVLMFKISH